MSSRGRVTSCARHVKRAAAGALLAVLAATSGCREAAPPARHVVILGLDGGTWTLLDPYIERGLLPNLARLRSQGTAAPLASTEPSNSPVIWTSIATGKTPQKHGIDFFVRFPEADAAHPQPVTSTMRHGKALWNILSARKYDVAFVGWFVTWPVEAVNGRMISDRTHWGAMDDKSVFPPGYLAGFEPPTLDEALAAVPDFMRFDVNPEHRNAGSADPQERMSYLVVDRFAKAYARDVFYLRAAERVLADGALPDVFALYLRGTDDVQHGFWKFMEPSLFEGVSADDAERFGKVIERYWQWTDAAVGKILSHYRDTPHLVVVVSDHGAGPAIGVHAADSHAHLHLSGSHRATGILVAAGPGVKRGAVVDRASIYDITPTILHYLGEPVGSDMDGRVLEELFTGELAQREVRHVATYDDADETARKHARSAVDEEALEHLRSLGYID